ncbi:DUF4878 domain-containing protein [Gillisia hiemivivida]|uniref:DUF4878 domain-containing protein n=1 Tax=Gillisia hiemivivida TaxID=291190 RepID=A0A5C6ZXJ3_9FLAO|nr:DUF4878 domain-containing protein [Gillisia hiemivivida]TXD95031.1 DUF4878 domain-containing protein [Gillisia hiemivivida]
MKNTFLILILVVIFSCAESQMSPTETAETVVESFYSKDLPTLEKYTTPESYESFVSVQELFTQEDNAKDSNFKLISDSINGNNAWVKFTTAYEEKPETFKLVKDEGEWKVTESGVREKLF